MSTWRAAWSGKSSKKEKWKSTTDGGEDVEVELVEKAKMANDGQDEAEVSMAVEVK